MTKDEWVEWKQSEETIRFMQDMERKVNDRMWGLALTAGKNPYDDAFSSGFITALGEAFEWRPEELMEPEPEEEPEDD